MGLTASSPRRETIASMESARESGHSESESTLVVAISSRALFDLGESHALFEREGVDAFARYQIAREDDLLAQAEIGRRLLSNLSGHSRGRGLAEGRLPSRQQPV